MKRKTSLTRFGASPSKFFLLGAIAFLSAAGTFAFADTEDAFFFEDEITFGASATQRSTAKKVPQGYIAPKAQRKPAATSSSSKKRAASGRSASSAKSSVKSSAKSSTAAGRGSTAPAKTKSASTLPARAIPPNPASVTPAMNAPISRVPVPAPRAIAPANTPTNALPGTAAGAAAAGATTNTFTPQPTQLDADLISLDDAPAAGATAPSPPNAGAAAPTDLESLDSLDGSTSEAAAGGGDSEVSLDLGSLGAAPGENGGKSGESHFNPYVFSRDPLWIFLPLFGVLIVGLHLMPVPRRTSKRRIDQAQRFFRGLNGNGTATGVRPFPKGAEGDPAVALAKAKQAAKEGARSAPVASTTGSVARVSTTGKLSTTGSVAKSPTTPIERPTGAPVRPMTGSLSRRSMSAPPAPPSEDHTIAVASMITPTPVADSSDDDLEIIESNDGTVVNEEPSHLPEFLRKKKREK